MPRPVTDDDDAKGQRPAKAKRPWWKRLLRGLGALLLLIVLGLGITGVVLHEPRPEGRTGPEAEAMARRMVDAVDGEAWEALGAVRWRFPRGHRHLWDKRRGFARVRWDAHEVLLRLSDRSGVARTAGEEVGGEAARELREKAFALWANDSFWLNPVVKAFDEGTTRSIVELEEGGEGLLVSYASGGVTPGDAYLWILDERGRPVRWRMWVSIIPIGGLGTTWEGWRTLEGGAQVATEHDWGPFTMELTDIEAAASVEALEGEDPFTELR